MVSIYIIITLYIRSKMGAMQAILQQMDQPTVPQQHYVVSPRHWYTQQRREAQLRPPPRRLEQLTPPLRHYGLWGKTRRQ